MDGKQAGGKRWGLPPRVSGTEATTVESQRNHWYHYWGIHITTTGYPLHYSHRGQQGESGSESRGLEAPATRNPLPRQCNVFIHEVPRCLPPRTCLRKDFSSLSSSAALRSASTLRVSLSICSTQ